MKHKAISVDVVIDASDPELVIASIKEHLQSNRYVKCYYVREMCHCGSKGSENE